LTLGMIIIQHNYVFLEERSDLTVYRRAKYRLNLQGKAHFTLHFLLYLATL